jgi:hypothetical protein
MPLVAPVITTVGEGSRVTIFAFVLVNVHNMDYCPLNEFIYSRRRDVNCLH